jgi:hypothetical protein
MKNSQLRKLDHRPIGSTKSEIRGFACVRNEILRLPYFLEYHRCLGVQRFFFIDNVSDDGTEEYLMAQKDCHLFHSEGNFFAENVHPPVWTNSLLNVFGDGHWCLTLDADEMFVYPHCESIDLHRLCSYLDQRASEALAAWVIDMYGEGPIVEAKYKRGRSFLEACPYFDPQPGWTISVEDSCPSVQMFGGVRERVFWQGIYKKKLPPCISTVPLIKWRKGMAYLAAQHFIADAKLSELHSTVLHFKFLTGFYEGIISSIKQNKGVAEKGLEERSSYIDALARNPKLSLRNKHSVRYGGSKQLIELGWMKTSPDFESFVTKKKVVKKRKSSAAVQR